MNANSLYQTIAFLTLLPSMLTAQMRPNQDPVVLKHWTAPPYWQLSESERDAAGLTPRAQAPANSLVFVGMTPCRVVDTRSGQGFPGAFGPPSVAAGASRTFPIQSSANCTIPSIAQAYSFNIAVVPSTPSGFITAYPTGQPLPLAATLVWSQGAITSNADVVSGGTGGSIDVFANSATDIVIDINGYYAPQTGVTLAQGSAGAPPLSFSGEPGTGIFSSGSDALNFATGGMSRMTIDSNGFLTLNSNIPNSFPAVPSITIGNPGGNAAIFLGADAQHELEIAWLNPNFARITAEGGHPLALQDGGGSVGIGTSTPRDVLEVAGELRVADCVKNAAGTQIAGTCPSDERLKVNIEPFAPLLSQLVRLQPVHFDWRANEYPDYHFGTSRSYGLIAQEVEQVFPELVSRDKNSFKAVNYSELPLLLLQAIRELDAANQSMQEQHKLDVQQNRSLESRIAALEAVLPAKDH
jgi:endosialidase-like protein